MYMDECCELLLLYVWLYRYRCGFVVMLLWCWSVMLVVLRMAARIVRYDGVCVG